LAENRVANVWPPVWGIEAGPGKLGVWENFKLHARGGNVGYPKGG